MSLTDHAEVPPLNDLSLKKSKKEKKEKKETDNLADASLAPEIKAKKRKHREAEAPDAEAEAAAAKKERKEKRKRAREEAAAASVPSAEESEEPRKSKKRKSDLEAEHESSSKQKSKKRKKSTKYPDPNGDDTLPDQSKKALVYVYSQTTDSDWKFNKARQNWLIRNIWSTGAVPEIYIPSVIQYLSKVQGRVRETLIESCKKNLVATAAPEGETVDQAKLEDPTQENTPHKEERARLLLDALGAGS